MNRKMMFAITVVIILICGGVAIAFVYTMNDNNNTPSYPTDHVKDNIEVNDYITVYSGKGTIEEIDDNEFFNELYKNNYKTEKTEKITFNEIEYNCYVKEEQENYGAKVTTWAIDTSGFILKQIKEEDGITQTKELTYINIDITKTPDKQIILLNPEFAYKVTTGTNVTLHSGTYYYYSGYAKYFDGKKVTYTVASINGDKITLTDGSEMTKQKFRSFVSKDDWIKENINASYSENRRLSFYDSPFGERQVTNNTITIQTTGAEHNIIYGLDNFLYYAELDTDSSGTSEIVKLDSTSMRT